MRKWRAVGARVPPSPAVAEVVRACPEPPCKTDHRPDHRPVAIVGGGLSGLACGWALRRRDIPAVVFDTGKRAPGGRASSRVLSAQGGQHVVDHAVQAFTVRYPEVRDLVAQMEADGAVRRWDGVVGTLAADGSFRGRDEADGPLWIGSASSGMGSLGSWLAASQEVVQDVWVAKLEGTSDNGWALLNQRSRRVGAVDAYSYVVMAHNGKCADRLINTCPVRTAAHAPLRCRFTSVASSSSDRLELSSLWVCVVEAPPDVAPFAGAFVEDHEVLSWVGNNSSKYFGVSPPTAHAWTLISTPKFGEQNKCSQEAIPDRVREHVSQIMCAAFGSLVRTAPSSFKVLHLQLWGAAVPLNTCEQHFIHDATNGVGVCGDWLTSPSVEGALFSGLALAEAIHRELRKGGLAGTGSRPFHGLQGSHAIGNFSAGDVKISVNSVVDGVVSGVAPVLHKQPTSAEDPAQTSASLAAPKSGRSRWRKPERVPEQASPAQEGQATRAEGEVWNFAFGANINPWKLKEKRNIQPVESQPGRLRGWRLVFNHKGGMGNIEPHGVPDGVPDVQGMLLLLKEQDFQRLASMEHEYTTAEVVVEAYDGRRVHARAFVSPPQWRLQESVPPPERYLNLIKDGASSSGLEESYQRWLHTLASVKGQRGPQYWAVAGHSTTDKEAPDRTNQMQQKAKTADTDPLSLSALAAYAVKGDASLVDIGVNLGKCSPQELAEQLVRASAARVDHLILTGCSVTGSRLAKSLCEKWNGRAGIQVAEGLLGVTARQSLREAGMTSLPILTFTAGVHPHDAKSCDSGTIGVLRELATHAECVAIGECGLDYDRMFSPREVQLQWCRSQVELAVELNMPLFLHERDRDASKGAPLGSCSELVRILEDAGAEPSRVCIHCFTGGEGDLKNYIARGYFVGLTGFAGMRKRGSHIRELLTRGVLPLRQLMLETDCPFMMPDKDYLPANIGIQGRRNEPCAMPAVCRAVAECLGVGASEVARVTTRNAATFFGL